MSADAEKNFLAAVRQWGSDLIWKQEASNTALCAAALEYAEAMGYRPPSPKPLPPRFNDRPDYHIKMGNEPIRKAWICRSCNTMTCDPKTHECPDAPAGRAGKPQVTYWAWPPLREYTVINPELFALASAAVTLYKTPYPSNLKEQDLIEAALDYAATQTPVDNDL